jgi:EAL domain-containing protein (putative c-di-GMP-specific phosphodiesterase class I)
MSSIDLIRSLQMDAVAEGIESADLARVLTELGCQYGQGYLFGRPKPLAALLLKPSSATTTAAGVPSGGEQVRGV